MSTSTLATTLQGYHLTFDAEFNDPTAPLLFQDGGAFYPDLQWFGNLRTLSYSQEQETYVDPSYAPDPVSPFSVANGLLTITAQPTPGLPTPWSSGALETSGTFAQKYGYFEMRAELPASQGMWPAFWLIGRTWTGNQEIDTMEALGKSATTVYQGGQPQPVSDYSAGFHTYGVLWEPGKITYYIDGQATWADTSGRMDNASEAFIIVNLAVGGTWGGPVDSTTQSPAQMKVDYVHAYALNPTPAVTTLGSGPDQLVLKLSQQAWQGLDGNPWRETTPDEWAGNAQFTVAVDGVQVGGTLTASAAHAAGQDDTVTLLGTGAGRAQGHRQLRQRRLWRRWRQRADGPQPLSRWRDLQRHGGRRRCGGFGHRHQPGHDQLWSGHRYRAGGAVRHAGQLGHECQRGGRPHHLWRPGLPQLPRHHRLGRRAGGAVHARHLGRQQCHPPGL